MTAAWLDAAAVERALPPGVAAAAVERALRALAGGDVTMPARTTLPFGDGATAFVMPASSRSLPGWGAKLASAMPPPTADIAGAMLMFDDRGALAAVLDGAALTGIRTAAVSAVASRALARSDAAIHAIMGTGVLAARHAEAIAAAFPGIALHIWGRDHRKATALAATLGASLGCDAHALTDPRDIANADIVSTVTATREPILHGAWLRPGTHLNLVGAHGGGRREADAAVFADACVWIEDVAAAEREAHEIATALAERTLDRSRIVGTLGDLLEGRARGRRGASDVTIFKSVGIAALDLFAAAAALEASS